MAQTNYRGLFMKKNENWVSYIRRCKKNAHYFFDRIAKTDLIHKIYPVEMKELNGRKKAYHWLALQMGISLELCHIGMMDEAQCKAVIEISQFALNKIL
jgi:hypothetical protein